MLKVEVAGHGKVMVRIKESVVCWTLFLAVVFLGVYFYHSTSNER